MDNVLLFRTKDGRDAREESGWARVRYWVRRPGCQSAALTFPALLEALRLTPEDADAVRLLAPGARLTSNGAYGRALAWSVTRLGE